MKRLIGALIASAGLAAVLAIYPSPSAEVAQAAVLMNTASSAPLSGTGNLRAQLAVAQGQLSDLQGRLGRATQIIEYSSRYGVSADLAARVYDAAIGEAIDPELAFRLVKLESDFDPHAQSPVGAKGLTQLMLSTARYYQQGLREDQLFDPDLNLHIGFRHLHALVEHYKGDLAVALVVYNGGDAAVENARAAGRTPTSDYERILMKGYKGNGLID